MDTCPRTESTDNAGHVAMPKPSPRAKQPSSRFAAELGWLRATCRSNSGGLFTAWSVAGGSRDETKQPAAVLRKK